ncbi:hypothetical protein [Paenibacillus azoreducens]|uniref:Uncharacterized protein n=1 Tax=Paenibacillus azoreducens TaxID=116718 RepID=A0A919Y9V0_9BACL|nr:hypothetical protein [Paenibacillus azoreducens]GIO45833.1 hypothetical protein J34TS1_05980 [Paenibacillus azoreducens]
MAMIQFRRVIIFILSFIILFNFEVTSIYAYSGKVINNAIHSEEMQDIIFKFMTGDQSPGAAITVTNGKEVMHVLSIILFI